MITPNIRLLLLGTCLSFLFIYSCTGGGKKKGCKLASQVCCDRIYACTHDSCLKQIANFHQIPNAADFFSRTIPANSIDGKIFTAKQIQEMLDSGRCESERISIGTDITSNDQINPHLEKGLFDVNYTYRFFKGIMLDTPLQFIFYRAKTVNRTGDDIIFSVQFTDEVRYFDLSNEEPFRRKAVKALTYDCSNPNDQIGVARKHIIPLDTYNKYLRNFWGDRQPRAYAKSWTEIYDLIKNHDCQKDKLKLSADENDHENNNIVFGFETLESYKINYSIALFNGINLLDRPGQFLFYKARNGTGRYDVIFEVISQAGEHRYYDLSNEEPIE